MNQGGIPAGKPARTSPLRRLLPWLVMIIAFALLFFHYGLNLKQIWQEMTAINYPPLIALSVLFVLGVLLFDALSQWLAFNWFNCRISLGETIMGRGAMMLLASVAYIFGQAGMAYYVNRKKQVPFVAATGTVIYLFFLEFYGMFLVSVAGMIIIWPELRLPEIFHNLAFRYPHLESTLAKWITPGVVAAFFLLAWAGFFVVLYLFRAKQDRTRIEDSQIPSLTPQTSHPQLQTLSAALCAFRQASQRQTLVLLLAKTLLAFHQIFMTIVVFWACGIDIPWRMVLAYMPLSILISALPITPARFGTTQWAWVIFFSHYEEQSVLIAFSLVWQFILNVIRVLVGAGFLLPGKGRVLD